MNLNPYIYSQHLIQKAEIETFKKVDSFRVMQKAAEACFKFIINIILNQKILVMCGPGNNGGDGILIAKYLHDRKKNVTLYAPLGIAKTDDSKKALALLNSNTLIKQNINFKDYDIVIDSVFGVGLNRPITEELKNTGKPDEIIKKIGIGKINKFKEENSLLTQFWVMDPKKKVKDIINQLKISDLKIKNFYRIKIGE